MRKNYFFFKSLLLATVLLLGSANAWGTVTLLYGRAVSEDLEHGYTAWSSSDIGSGQWGGNASLVNGIKISGTGNRNTSKSFTITSNVLLTIDFVLHTGSNTGDSGNYTSYRIGEDIEIWFNQQSQQGVVNINGSKNADITNACKKDINRNNDTWTVHMEIDTKADKLTAMTISGSEGSKKASYTLASPVTLSHNITTSFTAYISMNRVKGTLDTTLKSIRIHEETQDVTNVDYTINYQLNSTTVKTVEGTDAVDATITADVAVDGEGTYAGNHYLIIAATAPSMTLVDGENVLNVPVRAPYTATLNVTTTIGTNDPVLVSTPLTETDAKVCTWSYAYPLYVLNGGVYYKADNTATFGESGEFTDGQIINKSVTYSTADESIVFYREAENAAGTTYTYSNGAKGNVAAQNKRDRGISVGSLDDGVYEFVANITAANRRSLVIRQSTNDPLASVGTSNEDMTTGIKSATFTLLSPTDNLYINGANSGTEKTNQSEDFDYVLVRKVCPVEITSPKGFATLYTPFALDFTGTGLEAYTATIAGSTVTLNPVTNVQASTGVVLKGAAGTYNVPVILSSSTDRGSMLGSLTSATPFDAYYTYKPAFYIYGLAVVPETDYVQFTLVTSGEIPAGKAYLAAAETSAKSLRVVVDGQASEVVAPEVVETEEPEVLYNMAGIPVGKDFKGYVINQKGEKRLQR